MFNELDILQTVLLLPVTAGRLETEPCPVLLFEHMSTKVVF